MKRPLQRHRSIERSPAGQPDLPGMPARVDWSDRRRRCGWRAQAKDPCTHTEENGMRCDLESSPSTPGRCPLHRYGRAWSAPKP